MTAFFIAIWHEVSDFYFNITIQSFRCLVSYILLDIRNEGEWCNCFCTTVPRSNAVQNQTFPWCILLNQSKWPILEIILSIFLFAVYNPLCGECYCMAVIGEFLALPIPKGVFVLFFWVRFLSKFVFVFYFSDLLHNCCLLIHRERSSGTCCTCKTGNRNPFRYCIRRT